MKVYRVKVHGRTRWRADLGRIDGKRLQRTFAQKQEAENYLTTSKGLRSTLGKRSLSTYLSITPAEREDIVRAKRALTSFGINDPWIEIVDFYAKHKPRAEKKLIGDAVEAFLKSKREQKAPKRLTDDYVEELGYVLHAFAEFNGDCHVHEVKEELLKEYLNELENRHTYNNHLAAISQLFRFSVKSGWCVLNPSAELKPITEAQEGEEVPEVYTNDEVQKLLDTAAREPSLLPILAALSIALFTFLRISEVKRLTRDEIKLRAVHPMITVMPRKAKTRSLRNVAISPNHRIILDNCELPSEGHIAPSDFDWRMEQLFEKAGVQRKRNALRHSGASNHCVRPWQLPYPGEDHALTSAMLGHRNPEMLFRHYLALRDPLDGIAFWTLLPKGFPQAPKESAST